MPFTLCLNASTIKTTPLLDKVTLAAKHGFAGIELWINDVYEYVGQGGEVRDVEKVIADEGLIVPCTIALRGWGESIDEEYHLHIDEAKRRMELAARLGSPYIVATPPRAECDISQITKRYRDLLKIGRQVGCKPIMEYISFFRSVAKLEQAWEIVEASLDDDATIIPDAFHTWNSHSSLEVWQEIPVERIAHYHFDDGPELSRDGKPRGKMTDPDRVMPGDGVIDLKAEVQLLRDKGYDKRNGTVSLELFNRDLWAKDPNEVLKIGMERMQKYFAD